MNNILFIIVEGETESVSLPALIAEHLRPFDTEVRCILIGEMRKRASGGNFNLKEFDALVRRLSKSHKGCFISTFFDYYALGNGWPGYPPANNTKDERYRCVKNLEESLMSHVVTTLNNHIWEGHFIPHIQLHEFETLFFSQPEVTASIFGDPSITQKMGNAIKNASNNCEMINDKYNTCPSRRIRDITGDAYTKGKSSTVQAPTIMRSMTLTTVRQMCQHFDGWLCNIERALTAYNQK